MTDVLTSRDRRRLIALDAVTGRPVWESRVEYPQHDYTITVAPRIPKGKVIVGVAGSEFPVRGFLDAYDAEARRVRQSGRNIKRRNGHSKNFLSRFELQDACIIENGAISRILVYSRVVVRLGKGTALRRLRAGNSQQLSLWLTALPQHDPEAKLTNL